VRTFTRVWTKLRENGPGYRKALVASELKRLIPFQVHALRKERGWSQEELANRSGLTQGVISRAEDPDYGNMTFNTVISIAGGFDVGFVGKFVPFSELANYLVEVSEESAGSVPPFEEEDSELSQRTQKPRIMRARRRRYSKQARQITLTSRVPQTPSGFGQVQRSFSFEPMVRPTAPVIEFPLKGGELPAGMIAYVQKSALGGGAQYGRP
jgi:transcriptional regulator with XRE-family HTH domain